MTLPGIRLISMLGFSVAAAAAASANLDFEAVSVKWRQTKAVGMPVMRGGPGSSSPGRIHYANVSLMALIGKAYGVYADQVFGPGWLTSEKYDVDAVVPSGTAPAQFQRMLQRLLETRFGLLLQKEEREFTVYDLIVASGGPLVQRSAPDPQENSEDGADAVPAGPNKPVPVDKAGCPIAEPGTGGAVGTVGAANCMTFSRHSIPDLVKNLEMMVAIETGSYFGPQSSQAHIVDKTGLTGRFDFHLRFNLAARIPGSALASVASGSASPGVAEPSDPPGGMSLFRALET
jgi:uncharacterized protein (TIGR03435 family)